MEDPKRQFPVGDTCVPVQGAEAPAFIEGDQVLVKHDKDKPDAPDLNEPGCPTRKLTEALPDDRSERIPSRMVEDRGDDEMSLHRRSQIMRDKPPGDEDIGDQVRLPVSVTRPSPDLSLDPTIIRLISSDAALDEGYMVSELLKKGRFKNSAFTEKGLVLQDGGEVQTADAQAKKQLPVLLEATQSITLKYHVLGTMEAMGALETKEISSEEKLESAVRNAAQQRQTREPVTDVMNKSLRALSSSDEMLYFREKVRSAPSSMSERKGASCSKLQVVNSRGASARTNSFDKSTILKKSSKSTLPPAYSRSQLNIDKVRSQIAELTLKRSSRLSQASLGGKQPELQELNGAGTTDPTAFKNMSKITQIVISSPKSSTYSGPTHDACQTAESEKPDVEQRIISVPESPGRPKPGLTMSSMFRTYGENHFSKASNERILYSIKEVPVLEVLEKSEFPLSSAEKAKLRVKRYYRCQEDFFVGSPSGSSDESLVKLDLSNIPTEGSEQTGDLCRRQDASGGSGTEIIDESLTSWYSFDSEPRGSHRSVVIPCDAEASESSWRSYLKGNSAASEANLTRLAGLVSDALAEVARENSDQGLGTSSSGSMEANNYSASMSSSSSLGSCDHDNEIHRAASATETVGNQKNAPNESEQKSLKTSNLIRFFESIN